MAFIVSGVIFSSYPFIKMISGNYILYLLNIKGHKTTLMIGIAIYGVFLSVFGFASMFG